MPEVIENDFSSSVSRGQGNVSFMRELAYKHKPLSSNQQHIHENPSMAWELETSGIPRAPWLLIGYTSVSVRNPYGGLDDNGPHRLIYLTT